MNINLLEEVQEILDSGRRLHHYYKDQYAVWLLAQLIEKTPGLSISDIKSSVYAKLLERPLVKKNMSVAPKGVIKTDWCSSIISEKYESVVITLSKWGGDYNYSWSQTSRPGANLVLQFNFTNEHDQWLGRLKLNDDVFKCYAHPINVYRSSLAWSRLDIDFSTGEVLIEEIQNDWIRKCHKHYKLANYYRSKGAEHYYYDGIRFSVDDMLRYTQHMVKTYDKLWSEVVMSLTLMFIKQELGIDKVYYHEFYTGAKIKRITERLPPKSLYTSLPKKFCFELVDQIPKFLRTEKRIKRCLNKIKQPKFHLLTI